MHVSFDPSEEIPHVEWLRATRGAYEWWYFDAVSDDREYAFSAIWFLGNPFSPYYRAAALGRDADPFDHNALFFALYRRGSLHAYHFSRFAPERVIAAAIPPLRLRFGPSTLEQSGLEYRLSLDDANANRRRLRATIDFAASASITLETVGDETDSAEHIWRPSAPTCRVEARIALSSAMNYDREQIAFQGSGYHDHNRGALPFSAAIRDWYWARIALPKERTLVIYQTRLASGAWKSDILLFAAGAPARREDGARRRMSGLRVNAFGLAYATALSVEGQGIRATVRFHERLDSAPFYLRMLCDAEVTVDGESLSGFGIGEYFRPRGMEWALTASAMKARIVEQ
ncbi:hydroxyneurosporene dehydrogenase [Capsulimonas corticalis]|uniref:Hydroxyneurosporene dehydrogenase n=1 Tax=Capsulimonas corticalis TaxID=2219043 RepID=A0A402CQ09_9BACT|nr:hypothetical protein [Capsulimonas corticalis]BDI32858.1 hydroxyneurosporene dehydrogenase [Capsulimonas corticalis]